MSKFNITNVTLAFLLISTTVALADNQLWINDSVNQTNLVFGTGSSNKALLEGPNGQGAYVYLDLTAKWDKHTGPGTGGNATLTLKVKPLGNLQGEFGGQSTKPLGDLQVQRNDSTWESLSLNALQTVKTGLPNPTGQNTATTTVHLRIRVSFDDAMTSETLAKWVLSTGSGNQNLEWTIGP